MPSIHDVAMALGSIDRLPIEAANNLLRILDESPPEALALLVHEQVKFAAWPAERRLRERYGYTQDQIDNLKQSKG